MSKRIVFLGAAAAALWAAVPAAAADYPSGDDGVPAFHGRDEGDGVDFGRSGDRRRAPGPVVFDERGSDRRFDRPVPGYDGPGDRRPVALGRPANAHQSSVKYVDVAIEARRAAIQVTVAPGDVTEPLGLPADAQPAVAAALTPGVGIYVQRWLALGPDG